MTLYDTARRGAKDPLWTYGCDLTPELIGLTRRGGLVLSVFGGTASEPDYWLVTEEAIIRVQPATATMGRD